MSDAIVAEDLVKTFGDFRAVNGVSFSVDSGEIFGFLGPNGAGKTTTVRMLTGVLEPDSGKVQLHGYDLLRQRDVAKRRIGVVPELANAYLDLTALQNITFTAELYGLAGREVKHRAEELLDMFGLLDRRHDKVATFSKGMTQRVILAMSLINEPQTLFLDEPTGGLDVQSSRLIHRIIRELNEEGTTVFITTHNIAEANALCDRVAIINEGEIAAVDSPESLKATFESSRSIEVSFTEQLADFPDMEGIIRTERRGDKWRIYTRKPHDSLMQLTGFVREHPELQIETVNTRGPDLEEVFVRLTGGEM